MIASDLLNVLGDVGSFGGLLLAAAALVVAFRSADQADRSAQAAEATAKSAEATATATQEAVAMQRQEHRLLMRRPILTPSITISSSGGRNERPLLRVSVGAYNEGEDEARGALLALIVPATIQIEVSDFDLGALGAARMVAQLPDVLLPVDGVNRPTHAADSTVNVQPRVTAYSFYALEFPTPGKYGVMARVLHADIPGGSAIAAYLAAVPPPGQGAPSLTRANIGENAQP